MLPSKHVYSKAVRTVPLLLASLIFAGCTGQAPQTPPSVNIQGPATSTSGYYLQQMQQSSDDNTVNWQLLAIKAMLNEGQPAQAQQQLTQLPQDLSRAQQQEQALLLAQYQLTRHNLPAVSQSLKQVDPTILSKDQQARYYQLQIAASQGKPSLDLLRAYIARQPLLTTPGDRQKNIDTTWHTLTQFSADQINNISINADENVLQGWLDLLNVYRSNNSDADKLKSAISDWQTRYPHNPAAKMLPIALSQVANYSPASTDKIALLLPLSGQAQAFASAIQKGFDDARNGVHAAPPAPATSVAPAAATSNTADGIVSPSAPEATEQPAQASPAATTPPAVSTPAASNTQVQVYDTASQPIDQLLAQAQRDGATLVVGPLIKEQVAQLPQSPTTLNILALNEPEKVQNRPNICYFSLSPEDEARDAAHHMWDQGKRAPLLLLPRSNLGDRVRQAFASEWQKLGGGTVQQQQFGSTAELRQGLNGGAGIRLSGTPVSLPSAQPQGITIAGLNIPAPVSDTPITSDSGNIDSVYIIATQDEMALIKPMIAMRVSSRNNIGLYASSRSYQAGAGTDYRFEMEGLQFSDAPLLSGSNPVQLQQAASQFDNNHSLVRLYAMGSDAWALASHFNEIRQHAGFHLNGNSGTLSANADCVISRKLQWNQYRHGEIVPAS